MFYAFISQLKKKKKTPIKLKSHARIHILTVFKRVRWFNGWYIYIYRFLEHMLVYLA